MSAAASSQLHNPRAVWFLGAPVSKAIAVSTAIVYVLAEMNKMHDALVLGKSNLVSCLVEKYITTYQVYL